MTSLFSRLVDCGHTFCRQCLVAWFNTTFRRQRTNFPGGLGDLPFMVQYGCPSCRVELARFPVQNYAIKSVIDAVGVVNTMAEMGSPAGLGEYRLLEQLLEHLV